MTERCIPVGFKLTFYDVNTGAKGLSIPYDYESQAVDYAKEATLLYPNIRAVVSRTYPDHVYN